MRSLAGSTPRASLARREPRSAAATDRVDRGPASRDRRWSPGPARWPASRRRTSSSSRATDRQPPDRLVRPGPPRARRPVRLRRPPGRERAAARSSPGSTRRRGPSSGSGCLLPPEPGDAARTRWRETLRYTHGDRFPELPGHVTFTSHWHMAITMAAMKRAAEDGPTIDARFRRGCSRTWASRWSTSPSSTATATRTPARSGCPRCEAMFDECRRLSDAKLLFIPGEEANASSAWPGPGEHSGPLAVPLPEAGLLDHEASPGPAVRRGRSEYGKVYHVGDRDDMLEAARSASTAWPGRPTRGSRRRAGRPTSSATRTSTCPTPGSAPPGRRCRPTCRTPGSGDRALDLLDDMANWGQKKYVLGEVDVFKIDHTHELYGHMNINYLRLDRSADVRRGLAADARRPARRPVLRDDGRGADPRVHASAGRRAAGRSSLAGDADTRAHGGDRVDLPPAFAEVVSGDGEKVYRERIDLSRPGRSARRTLRLTPD